jgi:predicted lipoprotein with Yx(FWY)xxD motif
MVRTYPDLAAAANRVVNCGVQLGMNRTTSSFSRSRIRAAAAVATIAVLAVGAATATAQSASESAYGPDPTTPATEAAAAEGTAAAAEGTAAAAEGTAAAMDPNALVHFVESPLGTILVDQEGFTLYAFLNDTDGESTCTGDCLANWPAVVVEGDLNVGSLDPAQFSTVENAEAGTMLKMGDWPLYRFAGDAAPGDINGQGVGEVWYVVGPLGVPASLVNTRETSAGPILVDAAGMTLYAFLNDTEGESTCTGDCLANWPAAVVGEHDTSVLDPALWSTVENPEAGAMLKIGDWPLYTFTPDEAPGDVNGQGVGEVWYAVSPEGSIIEGEITVAEFAAAPTGTEPAGTEPAGTAPATTG